MTFPFQYLSLAFLGWFGLGATGWAQSISGETNAAALELTRELDPEACAAIDALVEQGIEQGEMAGAMVAVADRRSTLFAQAYGDRQVEPERVEMTLDTLFDLASLTKPIATACSVMKLMEPGKIELDTPVAHYLPEFGANGKEAVTVTDLLLHQGGLIPDNALGDYDHGPEAAWEKICGLSLRQSPGEKFVYTDVGFIVLGQLVSRVDGRPLDEFSHQELFAPLGMTMTRFNPDADLRQRAAATERREDRWMVGEVHDPRAYRLDGVAGHAGLFSTAADLIVFGQMLLGEGVRDGQRVLNSQTVQTMAEPRKISRGLRALGWDVRSPYSSNRGESFSESAFGHGGFTGTVFWVDPQRELVFVFLSTRLHPDGRGTVNPLAGEIATVIGNAVYDAEADTP